MANAERDQNGKPTMIAASNADGKTIVKITANPVSHGVSMDDSGTGSDNGNNGGNAIVDENGIPVGTALSSVDGVSIVEVYGDPATGKLLIQSM